MRDDFPEDVKRILAARAVNVCSNPKCKQPTSGPSETDKAVTNVGVASHITAASTGGSRYNPSLTPTERSAIVNGIWLCQKCGKAVDDDSNTYTVEILNNWKNKAEEAARRAIESGYRPQPLTINAKVLVHKAYFNGNPTQNYFIKITNTTRESDIEITHVWYESDNFSVDILAAKLPKRLKPFETHETWIPVAKILDHVNVYQNFRVVISSGEVFTSQQNMSVRPFGFVAGF
ncbi:MAG: hypothetical protein M0Q53_19260 [Prolixibacteraceae bacterium]|jgi:hypothetical protein|nr:hypothetical protein [Prolixibacteraceae bacterium]